MGAAQSVYMNLLVLTFYIWILKRKWATLIIKNSTTRIRRSPWYKLSDDIFMSFYYFKKSWIETSLLERLAWKSPPGAKSRFIRWRSLAKIILKRFDHTNVRIILANDIFILKILRDPSSGPRSGAGGMSSSHGCRYGGGGRSCIKIPRFIKDIYFIF